MSEEEVNDSQVGHWYHINDLSSVRNPSHTVKMGVIFQSQDDGISTLEVIRTTPHFLQKRGLYGGIDH